MQDFSSKMTFIVYVVGNAILITVSKNIVPLGYASSVTLANSTTMKKLKIDHQFAEKITHGVLRTTWRLFDDKDITVNDVVELIDKVIPDKPETWHVIGTAVISSIVEKRLGNISENDIMHSMGISLSDLAQLLPSYYGDNVNPKSVVKIISFEFLPKSTSQQGSDVVSRVITHESGSLKVYADGGSRGNPGPSASGYVITDGNDTILVDRGVYLGITTNNQAEYRALKLALEEAQKMHAKKLDVFMDSLLVINQMKAIFKVKNRDLWPIHNQIQQLLTTFQEVSFTYIPRELNKLADAAVNRALDEAISVSSQKLP